VKRKAASGAVVGMVKELGDAEARLTEFEARHAAATDTRAPGPRRRTPAIIPTS
jgi:hypothetical protein